ncbi:efflux RND transporter periplasmic adaptor subunit [Arcobacter sp. 15-2]|uniref:efflux RND transporter periplasmic adaptor subunit n=1 Tax=Arcobacter sp. 15-2 TaxID=3374109 RepID=UPI00399C7CC0
MKTIKFLLLLGLLFNTLNAKTIDASQLFNKKLVKVQKKEIHLTKSFYGDIIVPEDSIKDVNIRFNGYVGSLNVNKTYLYVQKGEKLFDIYSDEINLAMNEFLFRDKNLRKNYIAKFKSFGIDQKVINRLQKNKKVKEYIDIYSPYSGFVIAKTINDGSFVQKGKTLFQIASFKKLWVIAKVYQKDIASINKDMKAKVFIDGFGTVNTKVDFIYPTVDVKDKTVKVRLEIENKDLKIYPNMFAKVTINTVTKRMLVLPKTAVLTKANKHFVFIANGKEFEPQEITANRINFEQFEVIGLNENDVVIDKAAFLLDSDAITNGLYDSSDDDDDW